MRQASCVPKVHHLVLCYPVQGVVLASVFFVPEPHGITRGLYFGLAGSGTFDEAYFRMEWSVRGVHHFLECDNPEDSEFVRDRARKTRRRRVFLSPADARTFSELRAERMSWWSFEEGDRVSILPSRMRSFLRVARGDELDREPLFCACSEQLDEQALESFKEYWSLQEN